MTTKIPAELSSTPSIVDNGNATAMTISSSENTTFSGDVEVSTTAPKINLKNTDTSIVADQSLGVIEVESSDGSTGSAGTIAKLDIAASGAFDGSGHGSDFRFTTGATNQSGSIALTEVMRITSTARVGIGKTDPNYQLVVGGTNPKIQIYDSAGSGQTNLYFGDSGSNLAGYIVYQHSDDVMRFGTNASEAVRIGPNGQLSVGIAGSGEKFYVYGNNASEYLGLFYHDGNNQNRYGIRIVAGKDDASDVIYHVRCDDGDGHPVGYLLHENGNLQINQASDERLKENIVDSTLEGINTLKNIRQREFNFKRDTSKTKVTGYVAQEMESVYPAAVGVMDATQDNSAPEDDLENPYKTLSKTALIDVLIKATQEQQDIIDDLKTRIETLEAG